MRKKKSKQTGRGPVNESELVLLIRRMTSGKGRTIIEIKGLPADKSWCKKLAKDLKKSLGVGGAFKDDYIEVHGEKLDQVTELLKTKNLKFKQVGG
jgi:translation initiation factor 1